MAQKIRRKKGNKTTQVKKKVTPIDDCIVNQNEWSWYAINPHDKMFGGNVFFPIYQKVLHQFAVYPREKIRIKTNGYEYGFLFDWQDENTCGVEVYRKRIQHA